MDDETSNRIVEELKRQTKLCLRVNIVFTAVVIILVIVPILLFKYKETTRMAKQDIPIWTQINEANSRNDRDEEMRLLKQLLDKNQNDYYLHTCIGTILVQKRELLKAKEHFEISYRLFPIKDTKDRLDAVNLALGKN